MYVGFRGWDLGFRVEASGLLLSNKGFGRMRIDQQQSCR